VTFKLTRLKPKLKWFNKIYCSSEITSFVEIDPVVWEGRGKIGLFQSLFKAPLKRMHFYWRNLWTLLRKRNYVLLSLPSCEGKVNTLQTSAGKRKRKMWLH